MEIYYYHPPTMVLDCSSDEFKLYLGNDIVCGSEFMKLYWMMLELGSCLTEKEIQIYISIYFPRRQRGFEKRRLPFCVF